MRLLDCATDEMRKEKKSEQKGQFLYPSEGWILDNVIA